MSKFKIQETGISGLVIIEPTVFGDHRGFFMESYNKQSFEQLGLGMNFVQDNHSKSMKGVLRGLHFQVNHPQGKLVRVIRGSVWDVAVDLRPDSPTFGQWKGLVLSEQNKKMFYVPEGFAHGFLTLENESEFIYKCTDYYHPEDEAGIRYDDVQLGIEWPLEQHELRPADIMLSDKDRQLPLWENYLQQLGLT